MNKFEFFLVNNIIVTLFKKMLITKIFRPKSKLKPNLNILEIGCGQGSGAKLIKKYFSPKKITAIDLDKRMIKLALKKNPDKIIDYHIADATNMEFKDNEFDAIFDFAIIHHIPNWKQCLNELKRVLKPGGELIILDLDKKTFKSIFGLFIKKTTIHPYSEMFEREEFVKYLEKLGFKISHRRNHNILTQFSYFTIMATNN